MVFLRFDSYSAAGTQEMTAGLTSLPAGFTLSTVTRLLAAVKTTVKLVATDQGAPVLHSLEGHRQKPVTPTHQL